MRKYYFLNLLSLFIFFIGALILWPTSWINVDVGSFHYHKEWKGPNLEDLTDGNFEKDFDLNFGFDFSGGSEYTLYAFGPTGNASVEDVQTVIDMIRSRLEMVGYGESKVSYKREGDGYSITVQVPARVDEFNQFAYILSQKGDVAIWGERSTPLEADTQSEDIMIDYLKMNYEDIGIRIRSVKGIRIKDVEDGYALYTGLGDQDIAEISEQASSLYDKSILVLIDEGGGYPIDGSLLGEQLQYYGEIKTIQILGFVEKENALAIASLIQHGPFPVDLFQTDAKSIAPEVGVEFVRKIIFALGISLIILAIISIILYKADGLMVSTVAFWHFASILVTLKILQTTVTVGGMLAVLFSVAVYTVLLSIILVQDEDTRRSNLSFPLTNTVIQFSMKALIPLTVLYLCIMVLGVGLPQKYIAEAALVCVAALWINSVFTIRFAYRLSRNILSITS